MIVKKTNFTPAPEGVFPAVCVDVVDLGLKPSQYGLKPRMKIVWEIEPTMENGKRFVIQKHYTPSLADKSILTKDLKSWRGRAFTAEELAGFDLEKVVGAPCQLVISHDEKDGTIYANVMTILKADQAKRLTPSGSYIRTKDRPTEGGQSNGGSHDESAEEIPF
jgi:hypothetical protein